MGFYCPPVGEHDLQNRFVLLQQRKPEEVTGWPMSTRVGRHIWDRHVLAHAQLGSQPKKKITSEMEAHKYAGAGGRRQCINEVGTSIS